MISNYNAINKLKQERWGSVMEKDHTVSMFY